MKNNILQESKIGNIWTSKEIAFKMIDKSKQYFNFSPKTILDPAVGPYTFIRALRLKRMLSKNVKIIAYDIDKRFVNLTKEFMKNSKIQGRVILYDYLLDKNTPKVDYVIINPPYIRHERIDRYRKKLYSDFIKNNFGVKLNGRSNLYIYFLLKSIIDLKKDGILCAIVYDSIKHTKYGLEALNLMENYCDILSLENVKMPFDNVLIDAMILIARKKIKQGTYYSNVTNTNIVPNNFVRLNELVKIRRGTSLLNTRVFLASRSDKYYKYAQKFIKKSIKIDGLIVKQNHPEKAYLFDTNSVIPDKFPQWLEEKVDKFKIGSLKIMSLQERKKKCPKRWFLHSIIKSKIIFNYYIRNHPRYFFNPLEIPIADNFYAIYPIDFDDYCAWILLNSSYYQKAILDVSRSQGNGLHKVQVYEYKQAIVPDWRLFSREKLKKIRKEAQSCIDKHSSITEITEIGNRYIKEIIKI